MPDIIGIDRNTIESTMREARIPGASITYQQGNHQPQTMALGKTDKHHVSAETPVEENTVFGAASLSKPVFAYVVLKLIENGRLSRPGEAPEAGLDRPLHEILPLQDFFAAHGQTLSSEDAEKAKHITPRMLLSHSSGLGIDESPVLTFEPGTEYAYSGTGLMYLQKAIEIQAGKSLEDLANEVAFEPLNMTRSSFLPEQRPGYMSSTAAWRGKSKEVSKKPNGANSLCTTGADYTTLLHAWMSDSSPIMQEAFKPQVMLTHDNQKLPRQSEPAAQHVSYQDKSHLAWGLGVGLELDDQGTPVKAFHTGDMNQFRSQMALDLNSQSSIVYFANGRDHREANGHVLGPLVITPKIPIPHAHNWFYGKFPFAKTTDELIGGPNFGLRKPNVDPTEDASETPAPSPFKTRP